MNDANHALNGFSTYPFQIFGDEWNEIPLTPEFKGDTIVGNDVWLGYGVTIMPGVKIGDGAIIASRSTVTKDVEPYSIVCGNPATLIRKRFSDEVISNLIQLKWWDWPIEKIAQQAKNIALGCDELLIKSR